MEVPRMFTAGCQDAAHPTCAQVHESGAKSSGRSHQANATTEDHDPGSCSCFNSSGMRSFK